MPDLNQFKAQAYSLIKEHKFLILSVISFLVVLVFSIALSNSIKHVESLENNLKKGVRRWKKKSMFGDLNKTEKICNWYGYKAVKAAGTDLVHWDFKRMNIVENMIKNGPGIDPRSDYDSEMHFNDMMDELSSELEEDLNLNKKSIRHDNFQSQMLNILCKDEWEGYVTQLEKLVAQYPDNTRYPRMLKHLKENKVGDVDTELLHSLQPQ